MKPVSIRLLQAADTESAIALYAGQMREHDLPSTPDGQRKVINSVLTNPHFGFMLLATIEGEAVGVAFAAAHLSVEKEGVIGCLEELYVRPQNRGAGVGAALLNEVLTRAQQAGWQGIELEVVAGHERAARLYVRHGFQALSRTRYSRGFSKPAA